MFQTNSSLSDSKAGNRRPWALAVLAGLSLVGALNCGGGGGGGSTSTPPPPPPPPQPLYTRSASLSGAAEVPGNPSAAMASGSVTVDPNTMIITGAVVSSGIQGTQAHIHEGAAGVAGPVVIPLSGGAGGVWSIPAGTMLTSAQYASLQAGNYYFNVHSADVPAGEIRGQIELVTMFASLDGTQETPASGSSASGSGVLSVNAATGAAYGGIRTQGLTGIASHVHEGAVGVAGGVDLPLTGDGTLWSLPDASTLTAAQVTTFMAGGLYGNVHSVAFPSGEIRGQFALSSPVLRSTTLTGANEVPANASAASATGTFAIDPKTLELRAGVVTSGITAVAAHIHSGAVGVAGSVIVPLVQAVDGSWVTKAGSFLTPSQFDSLRAGGLYVNVHSVAYPGGEIRGQIPADSGSTTGGGGGGSTGGGY
jgi:hypothetical protein